MYAGLSIALSSLYAHRQALETTGHNIANVNTEGYTRQRVRMENQGGQTIPAYFSRGTSVGRGVNVAEIERLRDAFMEARALAEHSTQSNLRRTQSVLGTFELLLAEPGEHGLQAQLSEFWSSWDDVANNPQDLAARSQVIELGRTLATSFNQIAIQTNSQRESGIEQMRFIVNDINSAAQSIAGLNEEIRSSVNAGMSPNDALDKRDALIAEVAKYAGVTTRPSNAGAVNVYIGGIALVQDARANQLQVDSSGANVVFRWDGDNNLTTTTEGTLGNVANGELGALLTAVNTTLPGYLTQLDAVANSLRTTVNTQHALGLDANGAAGGQFFDNTGAGASGLTVLAAVIANPDLVAAAQAGGGVLDGENARVMANFANASGGPDAVYKAFIDTFGVEAQRASRQVAIQDEITRQLDGVRDAEAGVNLDEEMSNLVKYQHAFDAAARVIQTVDEMLDTVINRMR